MKNVRIILGVLAIASSSLIGCADDEETTESKGTAPNIVDVSLDKTEIKVGLLETITVTVTYSDAEGDVAKVAEQLVAPSGTSQTPKMLDLEAAVGQKEGSHAFALQLAAPSAGEANVSFWLIDQKGNESEKVTRTITAK